MEEQLENTWYNENEAVKRDLVIINRPGVAGAVLQTALLLIN